MRWTGAIVGWNAVGALGCLLETSDGNWFVGSLMGAICGWYAVDLWLKARETAP